jgi:hypothetical protein
VKVDSNLGHRNPGAPALSLECPHLQLDIRQVEVGVILRATQLDVPPSVRDLVEAGKPPRNG